MEAWTWVQTQLYQWDVARCRRAEGVSTSLDDLYADLQQWAPAHNWEWLVTKSDMANWLDNRHGERGVYPLQLGDWPLPY